MSKNKDLLPELLSHFQQWEDDNERRKHRDNGWDEIIDAYWGKLPDDWPFESRVVDPRIRTTLIEKNARLMNSKLRGRLVPREGGDQIGAKLNNSLLDFQWDNATDGGSMISKWSQMDLNTRLFGSSFGLVKWKRKYNKDKELIFDGNEFYPLEIMDVGIDPTATHVRNAKWVQVREYAKIEDLQQENDAAQKNEKKPMYPGLEELMDKMSSSKENYKQDRRDSDYTARILTLKGLDDRVGDDKAFPVIELVTEYREDRWITFSPQHKVVLRDIPNPYDHGKIPVVQLRYYPLSYDVIGESEVEPVMPLWRSIQAVICGYLDNMILRIKPPLKILEGSVRMETITFGSEQPWIMTRPDAVTEFQSSGDALRYFQNTYTALVAAFNQAMGDLSQGVSSVSPFETDKTATEIKAVLRQQNVRDQKNQNDLSDAIKDMMMMWMSNNRQFLFRDPDKKEHLIKIVGSEAYSYFKRAGLDEMVLPEESAMMIGDILQASGGQLSNQDIEMLTQAGEVPRFPVITNPEVENPADMIIKPKMTINDEDDMAEISLVPKDLEGTYDYIPDVESMSVGASDQLAEAKRKAVETVLGNGQVLQLLKEEGYRPNVKEMLVGVLEQDGYGDPERLFTKLDSEGPQAGIGGAAQPGGGIAQDIPQPGIPGAPTPPPSIQNQQPMAGPAGVPQPGGVPEGI